MAENNGIYIVGAGQLNEIANAIREKTEQEVTMCVDEMPALIRSIEAGKVVYNKIAEDYVSGNRVFIDYPSGGKPVVIICEVVWYDSEGYDNVAQVPVRAYSNGYASTHYRDLSWNVENTADAWVITFSCEDHVDGVNYKAFEFDFSTMDNDERELFGAVINM